MQSARRDAVRATNQDDPPIRRGGDQGGLLRHSSPAPASQLLAEGQNVLRLAGIVLAHAANRCSSVRFTALEWSRTQTRHGGTKGTAGSGGEGGATGGTDPCGG